MKYNPETKELEGKVELPEKGWALPEKGWAKRIMNKIIWGEEKVHPSKNIDFNE